MYEGHCLCGEVSWEMSAEPYAMYNCHCRMCQKVHGAAFGTYCFFKPDQVRWTASTESVVHYESSEELTRSACRICGSVVPYPSLDGELWVVPGGCHRNMRKPDYNIFVVDNSPWHTISGNLPECPAYPEESGIPSVKGVPVPGETRMPIRGSCLCGEVQYRIKQPFLVAHNCHCTRCRHGRAAAHASNGIVPYDAVEFLQGEQRLTEYKVPDARYWTQAFCEVCSSPMPRKDPERQIAIVPLGCLDDDPGIRPVDHIFVEDKAIWHDITDGLPQYPGAPPAS